MGNCQAACCGNEGENGEFNTNYPVSIINYTNVFSRQILMLLNLRNSKTSWQSLGKIYGWLSKYKLGLVDVK
jgi:hypothetical protein